MLKVSAKPEEDLIFKINNKANVKGFMVRRFLYSFLLYNQYVVIKIFVSYQ